ncbi:hypothetical protein [Tropicimonas sediminicola]|uniref:Uncharacterized protein n=1 Tax=Tropicimonas sediminicola TaxID=1031541 RepID=A0A239CCF3_9RHOB|nr:hypothetical protein [Tropicimonas sediminicola]SNS17790.1 hypothetical protein SAMN05421757_101210 [Tropicimonas sediminicola]
MLTKLTSAGVRAVLVAIVVATPSLLLPSVSGDTSQIVVLIGLACAVLTFVEYASVYPSLVEFRDAPPFNRTRYLSLFMTVFFLSVLARGQVMPNGLTMFIQAVGALIGHALDFPYSPVRLVILSLPDTATVQEVAQVRAAAGMAYLIGLLAITFFYLILKLHNWPNRSGAFNVWINLPTFDPTAGGDVVDRLNRDARVNLALGFLLPFLIPAIGKAAAELFGNAMVNEPQTMIWMVSLWAFLPLSLFMRGIAMARVADMILEMRKRTSAAETPGGLLVT